ncbi:MAG: T9SS type A sorting domain-containing protein [Ignavibacteria bacterium]|nr:T9SS type A sorting domain-containing protein [Ignavibacteria bacterium]
MKYIPLIIVLFFSTEVFAQTSLEVHPPSLNFGTITTSTLDSESVWIINPFSTPVSIFSAQNFHSEFSIRDTNFALAAQESIKLFVYFFSKHNLSYRDVFVIQSVPSFGAVSFSVSANATYSDVTYSFTQNLRDEPLKIALHQFTKNHTSLGYNTARDNMFEFIDDYNSDDTLECVYTGRKIFATNRDEAQAQNFNTEHTWPQSFFNEAEPMKSDLFHLFPTDNDANSARSNYPFGIVVANTTWQQGGSKLGRNSQNQIVFEPRALHKGNVARSLLYFVVRYDSNYGMFLSNTQESILRLWNRQDSVDTREKLRNNRIALFQQKRNPFIDHPEFVERISKFYGTATTPFAPEIFVSADTINFGFQTPGTFSTPRYLIIVNSGNTHLSIISYQLRTSFFSVSEIISSVPADSFVRWKINFSPTETGQDYFDTLSIVSNDADESITNIHLRGTTILTSSEVETAIPPSFFLAQNYPNPFNPETVIRYSLFVNSVVTLRIYDVMGKEVATIVNEDLCPGIYTATWDASSFAGGIYFYQLSSNGFPETKKMILLK